MRIFFPVMPFVFLRYSQAESNTNTKLTEFMYIKMKNNHGKVLISTCPEFNLVYFGTYIVSCSFVAFIPSGLSLTRYQASQKTVQGISRALSEPLMPPVSHSCSFCALPALACSSLPVLPSKGI